LLGGHAGTFIRIGAGWQQRPTVLFGKGSDPSRPAWSYCNQYEFLVVDGSRESSLRQAPELGFDIDAGNAIVGAAFHHLWI
jgi:hypothetical protein